MPRKLRSRCSTVVPLAAGLWLLWRVRTPQDPAATGPSSFASDRRSRDPGHLDTEISNTGDRDTRDRDTEDRDTGDSGSVSVVIPARNEADALPRLLSSLLDQDHPAGEIIVVDDHSTDGTGDLAAAAGVRVITPPPLVDGWVGKTWACHHGAGAATGRVLVFLDADVTLRDDALGHLLAVHRRAGGLVSVQPSHRTVRLYEQLSAVCNLVVVMGTGAFSGPPARHADMAFGPCLMIGRSDYDATGGHAHPDVRLRVAEDIALARRMRALGRPVTLLVGGDSVMFRMYPDGLRQLAEGWTKMIAGGARMSPPPIALAVAVWITGALMAARCGAAALVAVARGRPGRSTAADAAVYGAWVVEMGWLMGRVGRWRRASALGFPIPLGAFVVLMARSSMLLVRRRPARWKGRSVPAV